MTLQKLLCKLATSLCGSCSLLALSGLLGNAIADVSRSGIHPRYHTKTATPRRLVRQILLPFGFHVPAKAAICPILSIHFVLY
ncbi:hypothetical protein [[Phormidium] sp. ETS-05]|uniref:hypothetical protein n=1 Tax=[Phormidium] sp. ETS-05 TaxID=222819 RepID=UPI0018EEEECE|nr:hypothetical protein [[Phormidium] sp. ETS-05]